MEKTEEPNPETLSESFVKTWTLFQDIEKSDEPVASDEYQKRVKNCIDQFAQCTCMVNVLGLFSSNEDLEEISTGNLRFLLLPAFLGELELKITNKDRKTVVENAFIYFRDFLKRCQDYKITSKNLSSYIDEKKSSDSKKPPPAQTREEKIAAYKENKTLTSKIEVMQKRLEEQPDTIEDEMTREYHLDWLKLWVNKSIDNITMNNRELEMLQFMESRGGKVEPVKPDLPPMKPFLITRDMIQKQVFGAGYRSLPTMTEDEYFEKELREGKIVMDYNNSKIQSGDKNGDVEEKVESEDDDDEEKLQKARAWDEWKDTHRRGEGNKERNG